MGQQTVETQIDAEHAEYIDSGNKDRDAAPAKQLRQERESRQYMHEEKPDNIVRSQVRGCRRCAGGALFNLFNRHNGPFWRRICRPAVIATRW